jgi:transposase InsO family protein
VRRLLATPIAVPAPTPPAAPPYDINPSLTADQRRAVEVLVQQILQQPRTSVPAPAAPGVQHAIHLSNPVPVKQKAYRQSPERQEFVRKTVKDLLQKGIISESSSPWSSPVLLVPKHDGGWRMCIDYRKLNSQTVKDAYPIPLIEDCLAVCRDARWYTLIDIKDAYHHVEMEPQSIPLTAFVTPDGLYEFRRMPFGLSNAPATFQRYIDQALRRINGLICTAFFDDCLVFTSTDSFETHLEDVNTVLTRLREHNLEPNLKKCRFAYREMLFVGHIVSAGTIRPDPAKIAAVTNWPVPQNLTQLRSFLGLANYYHKFIRSYASLALPLYQLTRKNVLWEWSGRCEAAFQRLKLELQQAPCLRAPDSSRPFVLQTDASLDGLGAVLSQVDPVDSAEHPVCFISRQLSAAERNYSATELECLAVIWAVGQLEIYLVDRPFVLETDHSALMWMPTKKFENTRVMRWAIKLQEFQYTVRHRAGKANANADALSRCPQPASAPTAAADASSDPAIGPADRVPHFVRTLHASAPTCPFPILHSFRARIDADPPQILSHSQFPVSARGGKSTDIVPSSSRDVSQIDLGQVDRLINAQWAQPDLKEILDFLSTQAYPARLTSHDHKLFVRKCRNYHLQQRADDQKPALTYAVPQGKRGLSALLPFEPRLVVPIKYQRSLLNLFHDAPSGGHFGVKRTYRKISYRYYWPTLLQDVTLHVLGCQSCQRLKARRRAPELPTGRIEDPTRPFELISVDFVGPLRHRSEDFSYLLVIVDHFSRYAIAVPTQNQDAPTVASALVDEVFHRFGTPLRILSDRGSAFRSALVTELMQLLGVRTLFTSAHHPQTNGMVERLNGTIKAVLTNITDEFKLQWVSALSAAVFAYNTSRSEATGYSPFFLLYGVEAVTPGDQLAQVINSQDTDFLARPLDEYVREKALTIKESHAFVRALLEQRTRDNIKEREKLTKIPSYSPGDLVLVQDPRTNVATGGGRANTAPFTGPWEVMKKLSELTYVLRKIKGRQTSTVHVGRMKPYVAREDAEAPSSPHSSLASAPLPYPDLNPAGIPASPSRSPPLAIPSRAPRDRERHGIGPVQADDAVDMDIESDLAAANAAEQDAYAAEGYVAPALAPDAPPPLAASAGPAAAAAERHRRLPRPNLNENILNPAPTHLAAKRHSLPRRPPGS